MLSHDNITWTARIGAEHYGWEQERILSYLPLSHVAANMSNCFFALYAGNEVHFADADVLKTTLVNMPLLNTCTKFEMCPRQLYMSSRKYEKCVERRF